MTDSILVQCRISGPLLDAVNAIGGSRTTGLISLAERALACDLTEDTEYHLRQIADEKTAVDNPLATAARMLDVMTAAAAQAVTYLVGSGWGGNEILAVLQDEMGSHDVYGMSIGTGMAANLLDGIGFGTVQIKDWGVCRERAGELAQILASDPESARAVFDIGRVFRAATGSAIQRRLYQDVPTKTAEQFRCVSDRYDPQGDLAAGGE